MVRVAGTLKRLSCAIVAALLLPALAPTAAAFSQAGHMVTGAIAYVELRAQHPAVLEHLADIMAQHPDRGSFEVALDRSSGDARTLKLLMEMARWPDDVRKSSFDHPTWNYASTPFIDARRPLPAARRSRIALVERYRGRPRSGRHHLR